LDMDYIIKYHQCFPSWFTTSPFIPSHSICSPHQSSACFTHPFDLIGCQSIWHCSLTCIFVLPFLVFIISPTRLWKRPRKEMHLFASIHGKGLGNITKKHTQLEHKHWLPKDLQRWHQILLRLH
jgi:hypothetical protein